MWFKHLPKRIRASAAPEGGDSSTLLLADLALGPVSTYVHACERCHGPEGAFFSEVFQRQTREELHEINLEMMVGPGQLDPTEAEVDAMTDYMLAVRKKLPYLVLINGQTFSNGQTDSLKGEMRPGTSLSVGDAPSALNTNGSTWSLESPTLPLTLKATWKGHEREFSVPAPWPGASPKSGVAGLTIGPMRPICRMGHIEPAGSTPANGS